MKNKKILDLSIDVPSIDGQGYYSINMVNSILFLSSMIFMPGFIFFPSLVALSAVNNSGLRHYKLSPIEYRFDKILMTENIITKLQTLNLISANYKYLPNQNDPNIIYDVNDRVNFEITLIAEILGNNSANKQLIE